MPLDVTLYVHWQCCLLRNISHSVTIWFIYCLRVRCIEYDEIKMQCFCVLVTRISIFLVRCVIVYILKILRQIV
jgi:hypothetical protein